MFLFWCCIPTVWPWTNHLIPFNLCPSLSSDSVWLYLRKHVTRCSLAKPSNVRTICFSLLLLFASRENDHSSTQPPSCCLVSLWLIHTQGLDFSSCTWEIMGAFVWAWSSLNSSDLPPQSSSPPCSVLRYKNKHFFLLYWPQVFRQFTCVTESKCLFGLATNEDHLVRLQTNWPDDLVWDWWFFMCKTGVSFVNMSVSRDRTNLTAHSLIFICIYL